MSFQTLVIVGNLGKDPEMRYTPAGQPVTSFSVATNRQYSKSDGAKVTETTWFRVSVWGNQAEACNKYLNRGSRVLVEGRLKPDEHGGPAIWKDKDGNPRANFEVEAQVVRFLDNNEANSQQAQRREPVEQEIEFP